MRVGVPDRSPVGIQSCDTAPTPAVFAEIVRRVREQTADNVCSSVRFSRNAGGRTFKIQRRKSATESFLIAGQQLVHLTVWAPLYPLIKGTKKATAAAVNVLACVIPVCLYHFVIAVWRAKEADSRI